MPQSPMRPEPPRPANPMAHRMSSLVQSYLVSFPGALCSSSEEGHASREGGHMHLRGHTTTFQTRLEISRACRCWSQRHTNYRESWLLNLDGTQIATTIHAPGSCRLQIAYGPSCTWSTPLWGYRAG